MGKLLKVAIIATVLLAAVSNQAAWAQERKKTPALREQVYSQLARAQELADAGDVPAGLQVLQAVEQKLSSMNSYERAMLWNFYAYMHYGQDNIDQAIVYFAKVVDEEALPLALEQNTLYSLAQLALGQGNYQQSLGYLERWQQLVPVDQHSKAFVLKAQALYQAGDYAAALMPITQAIDGAVAKSVIPDENWLVLQRAIYFELKQTDQVAKVLEQMVRWYNKPEYWVQLAGVYGQLGEEAKQLAMLEAAYQQGFLVKGTDLLNLAQTYFFSDLPYKSGRVLEQALADQKVERNLRNLKMLAQAWVAARETDKAVEALAAAAELSDDGELDAQRATVLLNAERHQAAIAAAQAALTKGNLQQPGTMHLVIGMAELNQENYNAALQAFARAKEFEQSRRTASQWQRYAEAELEQAQRLAEINRS
ncbi:MULTISPECIES: tetratricopeptide repeat protein [Idiomarina]|uniref:tetratricopeptide repeat protein n=1 Tax=Idiomarina TaxID=135575 RepID=UPI00129ABC20|nr:MULTISPECIES: tetratricopeptide repeat protein [Idiomarina]MRJ41569.1 tetratricopeptide repeat protein [Idiomarina sp. FeN1]NCU57559.1 tetratricopeptide repeat protein [Idiomarina sp. FenA--70]NCU60111.1 tetratricopeptide repeat protein [Idiomarina sp. FenBw--71]UUN13793.1 tetratricopeptide repeat protein [Idiomarina loihiensis]